MRRESRFLALLAFLAIASLSLRFGGVVASARAASKGYACISGTPFPRSLHLHQPRGIAGHGVDFQVDVVALLERAEGRHRERMRDDQHRKRVALDRIDRKRDAVERTRY